MSESLVHQKLVVRIIESIKQLIPEGTECFIQSDANDEYSLPSKTREGYRPDVYYENDGLLIIGEAKTSDDVMRDHSVRQYKSYINACAQYYGESILIFAVPWQEAIQLKNLIRRLKDENDGEFKMIVLSEII